MNRFLLLPKLSVMGIRKNGSAYVPYIMAGAFSVFTFFVFSSIISNDIMDTLPRSAYAWVLMQVGQVLLGIILFPFIIYTNSFLIKRRKKELGLYSVLGLDKKHIALMMLCETLVIFIIVILAGIIFGLAFSKLFFLALLNLSGLPVVASFTFSMKAFAQTIFYFMGVYLINLVINVIHVFRTNPNDLLKGAKKGDKEPKRLWLSALFGLLILGTGYAIAIPAKVDSNIFLNFLLAVSLVSLGTHQFFKAGLLALLKILKKSNSIYYKKSNYVTISGMLHRMKKSASSLSNICIFSTMTIITLLCTLSVWLGTPGILDHKHPYDTILNFNTQAFNTADELENKLQVLAEKNQAVIKDKVEFTYQRLLVHGNGNSFTLRTPSSPAAMLFGIKVISLDDYNAFEGKNETLNEYEVLTFSTGANLGYDHINLGNETYRVKKELSSIVFERKALNDTFGQECYMIVKDTAVMDKLSNAFEATTENDRIFTVRFNVEGSAENNDALIKNAIDWSSTQPGYISHVNGIAKRSELLSTNGGLLFIGIFFSIIFAMCLILIMYYKQITEGYDDRDNFDIMQKVGMSDAEVKSTIRKQILLVFFSPLAVALLHTMAGFNMTSSLLGTIGLFDTRLIIICGLIVAGLFAILYGLSYSLTSRTYYKIVKKMNNIINI